MEEVILCKDSKVYIEGKLQTRKWQDKSGQDRYTTEVVVDGFSGVMQMLDSRGAGGSGGGFEDTTHSNRNLAILLLKARLSEGKRL